MKALVTTAVMTVREIQVLQAPHVAEADDAVMTRMEARMATSETAARAALATLMPLVQPASRTRLAASRIWRSVPFRVGFWRVSLIGRRT